MVRVVAVAVLAILIASCGGKQTPQTAKDGPPRPLLDYVPADTLYLLAGLPRPSAEYVAHQTQKTDSQLRTLAAKMRAQKSTATTDLDRLAAAIVSELGDNVDSARIRQIGLDLFAPWAAYGVGFLPVLRVTVRDPSQFDRFLSKVIDRAKLAPSSRRSYRGHPYWALEVGSFSIAGAVAQGYASLTIAPTAALDTVVPNLVGVELPASSMRTSGRFDKLARRWSDGYGAVVEIEDFVRRLFAKDRPIEVKQRQALGLGELASADGCEHDFVGLASHLPRLVGGYQQVDDRGMTAAVVVQASPQLGAILAGLPAPVPEMGIVPDPRPLFALGLGLDTGKLIDQLLALSRRSFACEPLRALAGVLSQLEPLNATPLGQSIRQIRGVHAVIDDIVAVGDAQASLRAHAILAHPRATELWTLAQQLGAPLPDLSAAEPTSLPLPSDLQPAIEHPMVAVGPGGVGVSIGPDMEQSLLTALAAAPGQETPAMTVAVDSEGILDKAGSVPWIREIMTEQADGSDTAAHASSDGYARMNVFLRADGIHFQYREEAPATAR
jgi:hypothetical protein